MSMNVCFFFFFFKQKTAYEMRISDWSSDVCSSDLHAHVRERRKLPFEKRTAIRDFRRNPLVLWRLTFDAVDDDRAVGRQSAVDPRIISPPAQPDLVKRRDKEVAGIIAGERPPGAARAMLVLCPPPESHPPTAPAHHQNG